MANSRSNPQLTQKQSVRMLELEAKSSLTEAQGLELADLIIRKENANKPTLSDTCIAYLMDWYAWETEKMERITKELEINQLEKGKIVEPQSFHLLNLVDDVLYTPNEEKIRLENEFLCGQVDGFHGRNIYNIEIVPDIKSVWDYPTYLCKLHEDLSKANDWQIKCYIDITGAREGFIADTLVNTPEHVVNRLKWQLLGKTNAATEENPEFKRKWEVLERSMNFDKIPIHKRVHKKYVEPMTEFERNAIYDRVKVCRDWLNTFHEQYSELNLSSVCLT
jgi:hypothetical protein